MLIQNMYVTATEAAELLGISATRFLKMQDKGQILPICFKSGAMYDLKKLRTIEIAPYRPAEFPTSEFATVQQALGILDISRRTFYVRVSKGLIPLHKSGKSTFVKLADLYTDESLF